jgi:hypothetical protein
MHFSLYYSVSPCTQWSYIEHVWTHRRTKACDAFMLGVSGIMDKLRRIQQPNGEPYVIYGDPAYGIP